MVFWTKEMEAPLLCSTADNKCNSREFFSVQPLRLLCLYGYVGYDSINHMRHRGRRGCTENGFLTHSRE